MKNCNILLVDFSLNESIVVLPISLNYSLFEVYFIGYIGLFLGSVCLEYLFPSFYPELISIFDVKVYFLDAAKDGPVFLSSMFVCVFLLGELVLRFINEQCLFRFLLLCCGCVDSTPTPFDMLV